MGHRSFILGLLLFPGALSAMDKKPKISPITRINQNINCSAINGILSLTGSANIKHFKVVDTLFCPSIKETNNDIYQIKQESK